MQRFPSHVDRLASKRMHFPPSPMKAESKKPLETITRHARSDYRVAENLSIMREQERERERKGLKRACVRSAYINSRDRNWIKVPELFAGSLHTCVSLRRNCCGSQWNCFWMQRAQRKSFCSIEERILVSMECRVSDG